MTSTRRSIWLLALASSVLLGGPTMAHAAAAPPLNLRLSATPQLVDVGDQELFTLTASAWPGPVTVTLSFLSAHHGFTGSMPWSATCGCFQLAVYLARRIHSFEPAKATATVKLPHRVAAATATFTIRGLAKNGRDYAPGGVPILGAWVSDPQPNIKQYQHYCAWVRTADGLGVKGVPVSFVVHYPKQTEGFYAGFTDRTGTACSSKRVPSTIHGFTVTVDVYAGKLRVTLSFKPR